MKHTCDEYNPNLQNVLVKLSLTDNFIALRTYDRVHDGRGRFLIDRDRFSAWLKDMPEIQDAGLREIITARIGGAFYDTDCGHVLIAFREKQSIHFNTIWLSSRGADVHGFIQHFDIPTVKLYALIDEHTSIRLVQYANSGSARISSEYAGRVIRHIREDKLKAHAFSKAMRDSFRWKGDTVTLSNDGRDDFYFTADGSWHINGGLILHESTVMTPIGKCPKFYYGVHT